MDYVFVGGPGRSGTSFVADRIGAHPAVASFRDVELKMFFELDGLYDLRAVLTEAYSPNRATVALRRFRGMQAALMKGTYAQPTLRGAAGDDGALAAAFATFVAALAPEGYAMPTTPGRFNAAARRLLADLAAIAAAPKPGATHFLEKTPHNLLNPGLLAELAPGARYVHVTRDPRAIAVSLLAQSWGPDRLDQAVLWVRAYLETWDRRRDDFDRLGLPLLALRIEAVSGDTAAASAAVQAFLGLAPAGDLFAGASPEILDRWRTKATEAEADRLAAAFAPWLEGEAQ
jgi:hypothetical protein